MLKEMIKEIVEALLGFELKIDNGVFEMHGTTRYRNIVSLLNAIITAIEGGRLCKMDLAPTDIHPDAVPIIERLSQQPRKSIEYEILKNKTFTEALEDDTFNNQYNKVVHVFTEPKEPWLQTAIPFSRTNTGESAMETITRFAPDCAKFRESLKQMNRELL